MNRLNVVELEKTNGFCSVEIYHGDITNIGHQIDLLIVSAFKNKYYPVKATVMGALYDTFKINFNKLINNEIIDLRSSLNCWITSKHNVSQYKNILIIEIVNLRNMQFSMNDVFRNLFISISVLEQLGTPIKSIAMSSLGTGLQNLNFKNTIHTLLTELKKSLKNNLNLEVILFIEKDKQKSIEISATLDSILNRPQILLPINDVVLAAKSEIIEAIQNHASLNFRNSETFKFVNYTFNSDNEKSIIYGIACRRLTEKILDDIYSQEQDFSNLSFFLKIKRISELNVAKWIISYLHVIRIFGNESAHEIGTEEQIPKVIEARDLSLLLFCMQRIVEFWVHNKTQQD